MEKAKSDDRQPELPMIIALNGPSSTKKQEIAVSLAEFLRCPLIDEEDITLDLKSSDFTSTSVFDELPFKIVTRIANTQLKSKLHVIINTSSLAQKAYIDRLLELARAQKARLVVVESTDEGASSHVYKDVPLLSINISKPFMVEDFASAITDAIKSYDHKGKEEDVQLISLRHFANDHVHEFSFTEEPKIDSAKLVCNYCEEVISGPTYQSILCDEFVLHQSCAERNEVQFLDDKIIPFYEKLSQSEYSFPEQYKCKLCNEFTSRCNNCLLQTHIKCGLLPTIWRCEWHEHPLNIAIMPFWVNYVYKCSACDRIGKSISYKCYGCNFDIHVLCATTIRRRESPYGRTLGTKITYRRLLGGLGGFIVGTKITDSHLGCGLWVPLDEGFIFWKEEGKIL